ncbi:MAG TPA: hypothetical protein VNV17_16080 [Solirubrobacteraceae bacterium]|nr:hypothetical protein [Solirubrobacteraceae bacterium]
MSEDPLICMVAIPMGSRRKGREPAVQAIADAHERHRARVWS